MTSGQCVGDVCHNPTLLSCQKSLWSEVAFAVQRWWAVTPIRPGMLGMRSLVELQWNPKTERPQSVESRDHTGHPRASWAWSIACLRAKKFLIFHHSVSFVMENCTIYQTSETSLCLGKCSKFNYCSSEELAGFSCWFGLIQFDSEIFGKDSWFSIIKI